jgi:oligopeptide/dipeptide ABC transporter ATP-binding protein
MRKMRREMQIVFQDPYSSLNPRMSVADIIGEPLVIHNLFKGQELKDEVAQLLTTVGLPVESGTRFPHEFSGGQRQRIGIARALALKPKLIIADEPVSALDVSIQSQILNLLVDLKEQYNLTYVFISHDLAVIEHISDHVAVMYLGKIVEYGTASNLYGHPRHPYTKALIASIPSPSFHGKSKRQVLSGDVPSPINPPKGCAFHPRCPAATDVCRQQTPPLKDHHTDNTFHWVACHHV